MDRRLQRITSHTRSRIGIKPFDNGRVISRCVGKRGSGQTSPREVREIAGRPQFVQHYWVVEWIDDNTHVGEILGGASHDGQATYIDEFDARIRREGVEVADHNVNWLDAGLSEIPKVVRVGTVGEDASMNCGMEGLYPATQHLGKLCHLDNLSDQQSFPHQVFRRSATGQHFPSEINQTACQIDDPRLVIDR